MHWTVAISFCILGLTGLIMLFGKHVLLPIIGYTLFSGSATVARTCTTSSAPLFIVSVAAMIVLFVQRQPSRAYD